MDKMDGIQSVHGPLLQSILFILSPPPGELSGEG